MRLPTLCCAALLATVAASSGLFASDTTSASMVPAAEAPVAAWPRWRGPSGQGVVADRGYVDRWSTTENVLWKVEVPGAGNSSPIIWDDHLFLTTSHEGGKRRAVLAFSRKDGKLLWQTEAPSASPEAAYPKNGHATSTPTTDGERVYAYFGNHGLLALDFDGKVVWHVPMGPFQAFHGTASSPLLVGERLFLVQEQRGGDGSFIAAFDRRTGKELWRTARSAQVGWNSPVAVQVDDRIEIVHSGQQQVIAYDPESGEEIWSAKGNLFEVIPTPVVAHDLIFCTSGRAGPTLAIRAGGRGDVTDSHVVWSSPKGSPFVVAPVALGEYLYMVNDMASVLTVYEAKTGEVAWQTRLGEAKRESFSAAGVAVDDKVFFTNDDGQTFVIQAGPDFEVLHVNDLDEMTLASPALVEGRWYIRTKGHLWAIGAS